MNDQAIEADRRELLVLNDEYIHSDQYRDIARYREILADDYRATLPDLVFRDKGQFLEMLEEPRPFTDLMPHDVQVRIFGDVALIHGRVTFKVDGEEEEARYTDTWRKRDGEWLCIAADVIAKAE